MTRSQWASETLEAYRHLFTEMATALGSATVPDDEAAADPMLAMMAGLREMMAPAMLGMAVGSMVGRLATRAFGTHDLPIPRQPELGDARAGNIDAFAARLGDPRRRDAAVGARPRARRCHACSRPSTCAERSRDLVRRHVGGFRPDPSAVTERLTSLDVESRRSDGRACSRRSAIPRCCSAPSRSPEQLAMRPQLDAIVAVVVGYTDWVVDAVAVRLVGGDALRIAEAVRRRRVETIGERHLRRAAARHPPRRGAGGPRQVVRPGRRRPRRRPRRCVPLLDRPGRAARRRPRSTPPASGSPASRDSSTARRPIWSPWFSISRLSVTRSALRDAE